MATFHLLHLSDGANVTWFIIGIGCPLQSFARYLTSKNLVLISVQKEIKNQIFLKEGFQNISDTK